MPHEVTVTGALPEFVAVTDVLVSAARLHDIGYAPDVMATGFHPLDGVRYLAGLGAP